MLRGLSEGTHSNNTLIPRFLIKIFLVKTVAQRRNTKYFLLAVLKQLDVE